MRPGALYICYYHLSEPLVQGQVLEYLRELARAGNQIHLLTFERRRLDARERAALEAALAGEGIRWHALRYHGWPSLLATLYDVLRGVLTAHRLCRRHGLRLVHARSHVPAAMALALKRLRGYRFIFDLRGLLADEYVDGGDWRAASLKYRLTKGMERAFLREADAIVTLTARMKEELLANGPSLKERAVEVIPCCVDTRRFAVVGGERASYRASRGWNDRRILTYLGKLGTWYLPAEMARFFAALRRLDPRFFFEIVTQSDPAAMASVLRSSSLAPDSYEIRFVPWAQVPLVLAASDAGISLRTGESKRAASPTKVGEYLAAGLPVVTNAGIGDCDALLEGRRTGVVLRDLTPGAHERASRELLLLLDDDGLMGRCRTAAEEELSLRGVGGPRYAALYRRLLET